MASNSRTKPADKVDEEAAPWEVPATEGDPSISAGREIAQADTVSPSGAGGDMQSLMQWCVEYADEHAADSAEVMAAEVRRILAGEDAVAVLAESAPLNGKEHLEKPFLLHSFTLQPTDFAEGWPFYASMECSVPGQGESFVLNCGGPKVIAALKRLHDLGEYPYPLKLRGNTTRAGFTVLQLVAAGAPQR